MYSISGLNPGEYMVQATAPRLALSEPAKISVTTGVVTLNLELKIVANKEQVNVGEPLTLQSPWTRRRTPALSCCGGRISTRCPIIRTI